MEWHVKIRELREKMCFTQKEMADYIGVSVISICRYENNINKPSMKIKRKFLAEFKRKGISE